MTTLKSPYAINLRSIDLTPISVKPSTSIRIWVGGVSVVASQRVGAMNNNEHQVAYPITVWQPRLFRLASGRFRVLPFTRWRNNYFMARWYEFTALYYIT